MISRNPFPTVIATIVGLALAATACGGGAAAPNSVQATQAPATEAAVDTSQPPQSGTLDLVSAYGYKDSTGYYHVVGTIHNGTGQPINSIQLNLELKDANGKSLLRDSNNQPADTVQFSPALDTLGPDEVSPFDYSVNTADVGEPAPNGFKVTVASSQPAQVTRAKVTIQGIQMVADNSGSLYITGELVNQDSKGAEIASFAGAALDDQGNVVASNDSGSLTRTLAPAGDSSGNDRTPFSIRLDSPGDAAKQPMIYLDAQEADPYTASKVTFQVTNAYFDENKDYHVVGSMTNNDSQTLTVRLVAGLYAKDGTPLDADTVDSAFDLASGQSVPFDFQSFSVVDGLPDVAAKLDHYAVQVDPYWTFKSDANIVELQGADDQKTDNGNGQWDYSGTITNTSGKQLSSVTVVVAAYDAQNKLVAVAITDANSKGSVIAVNEKDTYDATFYFDPGVDATNFTFKVLAQGIVK